MSKMRFRYSKTGKAKYISHLDLMATIKCAFLRAGVKLKYTEGFNPHPYMSVACPLSVGCESLCELMDVEIIDNELPDGINRYLPEGLSILEVYTPARKFNQIIWMEVICEIHYDDLPYDMIIETLTKRLAAKSIVIQKKSKSGKSCIDVAPFIREVKLTGDDIITMTAKISAQNPTISQNDILNMISCDEKNQTPVHINLKRIEIYDKDMVLFR